MSHRIQLNGVDGTTGQYAMSPVELDRAARLIKQAPQTEAERTELKGQINWLRRIWKSLAQPHLGLPVDVKPEDFTKAGWAIVFHTSESAEVKQALAPLIEHRRKQVNDDARIKEMDYRSGETRATWLARYGAAAGSVVPQRVPYYVLFVGSPEKIPFAFVHEVDVEYCVGFLHFDTSRDYSTYVESVIAYESGRSAPNHKEVAFFGTRHAMDPATQMSADMLIKGLADGSPASASVPASPGVAEQWGYAKRSFVAEDATHAALTDVLKAKSGRRPALLFTASHGMVWPKGHKNQLAAQGALLCQDWPGFGDVSPAHYFTATNVPADAQIHGLIAFHFACYGGGTPLEDRFIHEPGQPPPQIADRPFIAALPRRLLTHPGGGALACIAHVERAWGYSITVEDTGPQILPFQNAIGRILLGQPAGCAMKDFNEKYAALSTSLANLLEKAGYGGYVDDLDLASMWIERNDAEGYLLLGDPAVSLRKDLQPKN